ncbi:MAG TPA: hypothetical protein VIW07_12935 [Candidatus Udaeobacter sp.]|jgi:hypothetical protein
MEPYLKELSGEDSEGLDREAAKIHSLDGQIESPTFAAAAPVASSKVPNFWP